MDQPSMTNDLAAEYDYVIVGAGVSGICQLYHLLQIDPSARVVVVDANSDVGGTWFNNRYPGCRFDSESYTYGFSFSKELLDEWSWKEHFSPQPDNLRYLNFVADRFDLRGYMRFGLRLQTATWDEPTRTWAMTFADTNGISTELRTRFFVSAIGLISTPAPPRFVGMDEFTGSSFHTYDWPHDGIDLTGKRVGVIGTGATAVQVIAAIADRVGELKVFQRRPNWCAPLRNAPIDDDEMATIRARYDEIFADCDKSNGGFVHRASEHLFNDHTPEQRREFWEVLYAGRGFGKWLANYREILLDETANEEFSAFVADKIRSRVHDPETAEKLIPTDHGFGIQRVPLETNYYEAYNRDNVHLIDLNEGPIECITATGVQTTLDHHVLDVIVYATGFDAITGAYDKVTITGVDGQTLKDKWLGDPVTYMGVGVAGFPNMVMVTGPQAASGSTNYPRAIQMSVDFLSSMLRHMHEHSLTRVETSEEFEQAWQREVVMFYEALLLRNAKSWFTGYNANVEGRQGKRHVVYNGGAPRYRRRLASVVEKGFEGFDFA